MLARVFSGAVYGVEAYVFEIEVNAGYGDPSVVIVGLPDAMGMLAASGQVELPALETFGMVGELALSREAVSHASHAPGAPDSQGRPKTPSPFARTWGWRRCAPRR